MNIVAIIPARGGSKSIPLKNIINFCGKPLISWSIEAALNSKYINQVYVSTDHRDIAAVSDSYGAKVIKRPLNLARDTSSSEDALIHAVSEISKTQKIDLIVFLQATSPLREKGEIDKAIKYFYSNKYDSLFSSVVWDDLCLWVNNGRAWSSASFNYENRKRRQARRPYFYENGSIYIFKPDILEQYSNRLGGSIGTYRMKKWQLFEIDTYEDLQICSYLMKTRILNNWKLIDPALTRLIVYDFDGVMTNNTVLTFNDGLEAVTTNRSDGLAISRIKKIGIPQVIMTSEKNPVVKARAAKLNLPILCHIRDKKKSLKSYCRKAGIDLKEVVYVGNDINDLEAMKCVGLPVCPSDAATEIKEVSRIILNVAGGKGAIRCLFNHIKDINGEK